MANRVMSVSGRWPCDATLPTLSDTVQINSGCTAVLPYRTSALFSTLSCLGTGSAQGRLGVDAAAGNTVKVQGTLDSTTRFVGIGYMERTTGTTEVPRGGGST